MQLIKRITLHRACRQLAAVMSTLLAAVTISTFTIPQIALSKTCELEYKRPWYKTRNAFCSVGEMVEDGYFKGSFHPCEEMEVDHTISMFYAYTQGVCGEDLKRLANDPDNLVLTHRSVNRSKGAKAPREFAEQLPQRERSNFLKRAQKVEKKFGIEPLLSKPMEDRYSFLSKQLDYLSRENDSFRLERNASQVDASIFKLLSSMKKKVSRVLLMNAGESVTDLVPAKTGATASLIAITSVGLLAAEIKATCALSEDLKKLEQQLKLKQGEDYIEPPNSETQICGMSAGELFLTLVGYEVASQTCAQLRSEQPMGEFDVCNELVYSRVVLEPEEPKATSVLLDE